LADFSKIELDLDAHVTIKQGAEFAVLVEAESNLLSAIKTEVSGKTLVIETQNNMNYQIGSHKTFEVTITMPDISKIEVSGSGRVDVQDVFSPEDLELDIAGSGSIKGNFIAEKIEGDISGSGSMSLNGSAEKLGLDITGSGDADAVRLRAKQVSVDLSGSGTATVLATEELEADVAGSGWVKYKGNPSRIKQDITGSGRVAPL